MDFPEQLRLPLHPWTCPRPGWVELRAPWDGGRRPCPWNRTVFTAPCSPNQSVILGKQNLPDQGPFIHAEISSPGAVCIQAAHAARKGLWLPLCQQHPGAGAARRGALSSRRKEGEAAAGKKCLNRNRACELPPHPRGERIPSASRSSHTSTSALLGLKIATQHSVPAQPRMQPEIPFLKSGCSTYESLGEEKR